MPEGSAVPLFEPTADTQSTDETSERKAIPGTVARPIRRRTRAGRR